MRIDGEQVTVAQLAAAVVVGVRGMRAFARDTKRLAALGSPALVDELADHLSGWVTKAVQAATDSPTDLSGARGLDDVVQRFQTAVRLLDDGEPGRSVAYVRDKVVAAARWRASADRVVRGRARRELATAVWWARDARDRYAPKAAAA